MTASNAVLSEMNMPMRPTKDLALVAWKKAMSGYKGAKQPELCEASAPFSESAGKRMQLPRGTGEEAGPVAGNDHWSGYVDTQGSFTAVGAEWYQTSPFNNGTSAEVTWVGIGGWNSGKLLQDGTTTPGSDEYQYAFWEYLGGKSVGILSVNQVSSGDTIEAQVYYAAASTGTAKFYVHDDGIMVLNERETGINQDYDSSTVEYINERPERNGPYLPLTNTGVTYFWDSNGINSSGSSVPVGANGVIGVEMTTDGSIVTANCSSSSKMLQ
ncbi:MAG: G1 family glutamic endopeptidase, partial [Trebonia sp.]